MNETLFGKRLLADVIQKTKAETRVMLPQTKEHLEPQTLEEARKDRSDLSELTLMLIDSTLSF